MQDDTKVLIEDHDRLVKLEIAAESSRSGAVTAV